MNFFDDCDLILKIHYDHYFKGLLDENHNQIWNELDPFFRICEQNLTTTEYGYVQAIHHQLTTDGYLIPIGEQNELTHKIYRVTPKGFAFVQNGAFKQQLKSEKEKLTLNRINSFSGILGWVVAALFSSLTMLKSCQDDNKNKEINALKLNLSQLQSNTEASKYKNQKSLSLQQNPKQIQKDTLHRQIRNK